jgi:hypothetical protein
MTIGAVVWLGVLIALLVLAVVVLRRAASLVARTRELERFQQAVASLDGRLEASIDPLVGTLDELRRGPGDPQVLADRLEVAQSTLRGLATEGHALLVPPALAATATSLTEELDRAVRATEFVEHGLGALRAERGGRELEAQTALKRGALNLRHAREAFGRLATKVAATRPADIRGQGPAAPVVARPGSVPAPDDVPTDDDGGDYPRM